MCWELGKVQSSFATADETDKVGWSALALTWLTQINFLHTGRCVYYFWIFTRRLRMGGDSLFLVLNIRKTLNVENVRCLVCVLYVLLGKCNLYVSME